MHFVSLLPAVFYAVALQPWPLSLERPFSEAFLPALDPYKVDAPAYRGKPSRKRKAGTGTSGVIAPLALAVPSMRKGSHTFGSSRIKARDTFLILFLHPLCQGV